MAYEKASAGTEENEVFQYSPNPLLLFDFSKIGNILRNRKDTQDDPEKYIDPATLIKNGSLVKANKAALKLYEAEDTNQLQQNLENIIPEKAFQTLYNALRALDNGKREFSQKTVNRTLSGSEFPIILKFSVLPGNESSFQNVLVAANDISQAAALEDENSLLKLLPQTNPNIVLILECSYQISYLNPAGWKWLSRHGYSSLDGIKELLPGNFQEKTCAYCMQRFPTRYTVSHSNRVYNFTVSPLAEMKRCMITVTDVTDFTKISEERELFFKAIRNAIDPMVITDKNGIILHVNPRFEELYGYFSEEVVGKRPNVLNPGKHVYFNLGYSEDDYNRLFAGLWKAIMDPYKATWTGEIPNRKKDGSLVWVELMVNAIFDDQGEITNFIGIPHDISKRREQELNTRLEIFKTITDLAEMRDNETGNHIVRVGLYARKIAEKIGLPQKVCDDIQRFAPLHDVGKVGISDGILLAQRKLSPDEWKIMQTHTELGYDLLKEKKVMSMAADIAGLHHEKFDGSGYPKGLQGKEIPLSARITAIADVYDALRSKRPYKQPWNHEDAVNEIVSLSGKHFDPELVKAFLSLEGQVREIADSLKD
ncbi:MAG: HD domain-containing phosphohydrolase [Spirochaetia bacterium]